MVLPYHFGRAGGRIAFLFTVISCREALNEIVLVKQYIVIQGSNTQNILFRCETRTNDATTASSTTTTTSSQRLQY